MKRAVFTDGPELLFIAFPDAAMQLSETGHSCKLQHHVSAEC